MRIECFRRKKRSSKSKHIPFYFNRIPSPALSWRGGSMTVEAALILPTFLFAMLSVVYLGLMIQCQDEVQWALTKTARELSAEYAATEKKELANTAYCQTKMAVNLGES
ncbi:MAG: pilus assembly protein, partial [Eubacterium sp.]|nr:pilus assembly protein [Eubacterium sp.]